ncbi:RloB family protein [uncultured Desulfobacter sp.]|uniref:RloB family protein n=1 Tax=uncultured Desulfobacter sp. TaxID=240139 RepID=UPI0029F54800|nr:RloB family protein [uncultured Desulfobacter sp.]
MSPRRRFSRLQATRSYNKLFIISAEGEQTEPQFFAMLNSMSKSRVTCLKNIHGSSPSQILKIIQKGLKNKNLRKGDEAWIVVDRDSWAIDDLNALVEWKNKKGNYHLALSNPKFEYWLLLHFEDGKGIRSIRNCEDRLKRYLPNYNKDIQVLKIKAGIRDAIARAKTKDTPRCTTWPRQTGTTVYRLVEKILEGI